MLSKILFLKLPLLFSCCALAQSSDQTVEPSKSDLQQKSEQLKKQLPTNKEGLENTADTSEEAVKPLLAKDEKLLEMIRRSRQVTVNHAKYLQDIASGKNQPFSELRELYQTKYPAILANLSAQNEAIFAERNPAKQKQMVQLLQKALFPIGAYLQPAGYENADMTLTKEQHVELVRLQELDPRTQIGKPSLPELKAQSDNLTYTFLHLPVYMQVKAQPNSKVYFRSGGGGQFSNGLPLQEVIADKDGIASTSWVSKGDSIGNSIITVTSPQSSSPEFFRIKVVNPSLMPLPTMPKIKVPLKPKNSKNTESLKSQPEETKKSLQK